MNKCLYCLRSDGGFVSEEHTIPRGLGNEEFIIPPGIVCDRCNNRILANLDEELLNFDPINFMRAFYGLPTRKGNPSKYRNVAFDMQHTGPNHIHINAPYSDKAIVDTADGFTLNMRSNKQISKPYLKKLARAFYKIGLGLVYLDLGKEVAYSKRFDEVRKIILGEIDFNGYLVIMKKPLLEKTATVQHWDRVIDEGPISYFRFYYYGIEIFYDMEYRTIDVPEGFPIEKINLLQF